MPTISTVLVTILLAVQAPAGQSPSSGAAPATAIQPASGGQVGQAPPNSAMRTTAGGGQTRPASTASANPMGMAGMGTGGGGATTNALTLTSGDGQSQSRQPGQAGQGQGSVSITDTGVTQRTPARQQSPR